MANPYTRNIRYNYQPLDMTQIGNAALENQAKYDQTESAINEFDISINALDEQKDYANKKSQEFRDEATKISNELKLNKDPKQAMSQMISLNKRYKRFMTEGEGAILEGNVAADAAYRKRHQEQYKQGLAPADFNTWYSGQRGSWEAFKSGKATSISLQDMTENKSKDMREHALKLAELDKGSVIEQLGKYTHIGGFNKQAIDTTITNQDGSVNVEAIQKILENTQEYKPWLDQERQLIEYRNKNFDGESYFNEEQGRIDEQIKLHQSRVDNPSISEEDKEKSQAYIDSLKAKKNEYLDYLNDGKNDANSLGKRLYNSRQYNQITRGAADQSNMVQNHKVTYDRNNIKDDLGVMNHADNLARARDYDKQKQEIGDIVESLGKSRVDFSDMNADSFSKAIGKLKASVNSGNATDTEKANYVRAKYYEAKVNEKTEGFFTHKGNVKEMAELGITKEELIDGTLTRDIMDNLAPLSSLSGVDMASVDEKVAKYNETREGSDKYTKSLRYGDDGQVYVSILDGQGRIATTVSAVGNHRQSWVFKAKDPALVNKTKMMAKYNGAKDAIYEEGIAIGSSIYTPDTEARQKVVSNNFISNMQFNEFTDPTIDQSQIEDAKLSKNRTMIPNIDWSSGTVKFKVAYTDDGGERKTFTITEPIFRGENSNSFGNVTSKWIDQLGKSESAKSERLKEDLRDTFKYKKMTNTFRTGDGVDDELFDMSSKSIEQFITMSPANKGKYAFTTETGGTGYIIKKGDDGKLTYIGMLPNSNSMQALSQEDFDEFPGALLPVNKGSALRTLQGINQNESAFDEGASEYYGKKR